jgi:beta-phosphoglucomutase-like phosphatase (HAD superfamily)
MMLKPVGLIGFFEGRIFSGHEMPRSKPHPDVYLAAAAHLQIDPAGCLIIEDTKEGITAGVAAGATVWAYAAPPAEHAPLVQVGAARVFTGMHELPLV